MSELPVDDRPTTDLRPLNPKVRSVWRIGSFISATVLGLGGLAIAGPIGAALDASLPLVLPIAFVVVAGVSLVLSNSLIDLQFSRWRYQLRKHDLMIQKGVVWQSERHIARDRIQHIDINAGPIDRRFGLVQVVVYAAGIAGSVGLIPGLSPEEANWLRDELLATRAQDA